MTIQRTLCVVLGLLVVVGAASCEGPQSYPRSQLDQRMFGPASIRIHPTFTQVRDWTGGGKPDGIEATLEIQDQFGEPTRSTGHVRFELFDYRKDAPDVRGRRLGEWIAYLDTRAQQDTHWNSALRAYTFQLHYPGIALNRYYVLTAQFDLNGDGAATRPAEASGAAHPGRMFARLIIEPQTQEKVHGHYRAPHRTPGQ